MYVVIMLENFLGDIWWSNH